MKFIAFVPVRGGSKSIPLKNIKIINGKPLVYWVLKALQNSTFIDTIILATDSNIIKDTVKEFSFSKVHFYNRKSENAQDKSSTESVMLEYLNKGYYNPQDYIILVQATNPFIESKYIDEACDIIKNSNYDSLLSCVRTKRFFWNENGEAINYDYNKRPRRQDFTGILLENGAFYINKMQNIVINKNRLSGSIKCYEMPEYTGYEIDEEYDWIIAEKLLEKYKNNIDEKIKIEIKLVITDVDGVLTDAGMYYAENGDEQKKFNTRDGMGFQLLKEGGIKTAIITSESTNIVERRAMKLKVDYLNQGIKNKLKTALELCNKENIKLENVAFIGDDINDLELLGKVGVAACPSNAVEVIKGVRKIKILNKKGGEGVFREFVELILNKTYGFSDKINTI